jgi:predicted transcriptional regulator
MPKTNYSNKPVRSFRISREGVRQLKALASNMGRGESDVIEVALDRMYREEIRFGQLIREGQNPEDNYQVTETEKE